MEHGKGESIRIPKAGLLTRRLSRLQTKEVFHIGISGLQIIGIACTTKAPYLIKGTSYSRIVQRERKLASHKHPLISFSQSVTSMTVFTWLGERWPLLERARSKRLLMRNPLSKGGCCILKTNPFIKEKDASKNGSVSCGILLHQSTDGNNTLTWMGRKMGKGDSGYTWGDVVEYEDKKPQTFRLDLEMTMFYQWFLNEQNKPSIESHIFDPVSEAKYLNNAPSYSTHSSSSFLHATFMPSMRSFRVLSQNYMGIPHQPSRSPYSQSVPHNLFIFPCFDFHIGSPRSCETSQCLCCLANTWTSQRWTLRISWIWDVALYEREGWGHVLHERGRQIMSQYPSVDEALCFLMQWSWWHAWKSRFSFFQRTEEH